MPPIEKSGYEPSTLHFGARPLQSLPTCAFSWKMRIVHCPRGFERFLVGFTPVAQLERFVVLSSDLKRTRALVSNVVQLHLLCTNDNGLNRLLAYSSSTIDSPPSDVDTHYHRLSSRCHVLVSLLPYLRLIRVALLGRHRTGDSGHA
jgi:hypothetical protein